ncbi:MAG TPA: PilZ domain-containing protein, partial [Candidatus Limnocylindrales bacterium]|nr:PilZ domain-containing protein [Candidatus Limnocylindrales bacterium]
MNQQMDAAVRFLWHDGQGSLRMGVGTTRDLSRHGIFVRTDESPAPGAEVQVLVDLPASDRTREGRLMGKGVAVLRERKNGQVAGFAAAVLFQPGWAGSLADGISFELDSEVGLRGLEACECDTTVPATW